jgi:opacity protein-like surface antigen
MKKLSLLASLVVLCLPLAASAQEAAPKVEISGGYSFLRLNLGATVSGVPGVADSGHLDLHGFNASFAGNVARHVGIVSEVSRYTKSASAFAPASVLGNLSGDVSVLTLLFGPRVTLHRGKGEPFVHALFGAARATAAASGPGLSQNAVGYAFAYALGGGFDFKVHNNFAIRLAQLDYLGARAGGDGLNNFRYSAGVVIRLGNR